MKQSIFCFYGFNDSDRKIVSYFVPAYPNVRVQDVKHAHDINLGPSSIRVLYQWLVTRSILFSRDFVVVVVIEN